MNELIQQYRSDDRWYGKVLVMSIFHTTMSFKDRTWTLTRTAQYFEVSVALVSENLKLANELDKNRDFINCKSRQEALNRLRR
jgi:hypothetical protein